jgi:hypothetical protein
MEKPSIYCMSKIWHSQSWIKLRDTFNYNIIATWIDIGGGTPKDKSSAVRLTPEQRTGLWDNCRNESCEAEIGIVYAESDDEMRGVLIEMGQMFGASYEREKLGKSPTPIYVIGNCKTFSESATSDVAFMFHSQVIRVGATDIFIGTWQAVNHYLQTRKRFGDLVPLIRHRSS